MINKTKLINTIGIIIIALCVYIINKYCISQLITLPIHDIQLGTNFETVNSKLEENTYHQFPKLSTAKNNITTHWFSSDIKDRVIITKFKNNKLVMLKISIQISDMFNIEYNSSTTDENTNRQIKSAILYGNSLIGSPAKSNNKWATKKYNAHVEFDQTEHIAFVVFSTKQK